MLEVTLRPFESEIIDNFKTFSVTAGGGKSRPRKGVWIKGHLLSVGGNGDFVYSMWKRWTDFALAAHEMGAGIEFGTYTSFRTYIYLLKKYGLIIPTKRERAKTTTLQFQRQYYKVNPARLEDPLWRNPYSRFPGWKKWQQKGFPRPKKKPKIPKALAAVPSYPFLPAAELDRIWNTAERFLMANRYTITRKDLEEINSAWGLEAAAYPSFKERVGYVIHEAVEIEEVSLVARRLIDPRLAPGPVAARAHEKADRMEKEWLRSL